MKRYYPFVSILLILGITYWSFYSIMPQNYTKKNAPSDNFATERALVHVKAMTKKPHYTGNSNHKEVQKYIIDQLEAMGLFTSLQHDYTMNQWKTLSEPENIITRIKGTGNGEAILLLAHYDSSPHSSLGASDDASGVATIIEAIRAFKAARLMPKNDIIILISDGEEIGLSGAELFVEKHPWAKDVRLVLNFEARGSGGPSYMLIETNGGNAKMIEAFKKADVRYPLTNSLAYSVYKMLPNDTDLTVFRKKANINGFNFAFIDDHFDYHTARDNYQNLDKNTLEHQGTYIMPLLHYFAYANLNTIKSTTDKVYFTTPIGLHHYSFLWIFPLVIIAGIAFGFLIYMGFREERLAIKPILIGFLPFLIAMVLSTMIAYYSWDLLLHLYPQYKEILQGFTYNGYLYIAATVTLTLAICFISYAFFNTKKHIANYVVAPLLIWIIINIAIALYLKGASFFIIPVYFGLLLFYFILKQKKPNIIILTIIALPIVLICVTFVPLFPVALGLKMIAISALLTTLLFGFLLPVFGYYRFKRSLALVFFILFAFFITKAHLTADFDKTRQKPNSLSYLLNTDKGSAHWVTYDQTLDSWTTEKLSSRPGDPSSLNKNTLPSKYNTHFSYAMAAPIKRISPPKVAILRDTILGKNRHITLCITPQRDVNRIDIYADATRSITTLTANGETLDLSLLDKAVKNKQTLLLKHYIRENGYLELSLTLSENTPLNLTLLEASFDLLNHPEFTISPRSENMIPKPFVLNDAVIIKKTIPL